MDINIDDTNIKPKDINDLTKGSLTGSGVFDVLMASAELHIQDEYKKQRITGSNYATTYLGIIQTVLQLSTQFVLQQDNSWIELEKLKLEKEKLKIELELQQAELKIKETQLEIAKVQLEQEKQKIPLIKAQALTELAKTKDIIPSDEECYDGENSNIHGVLGQEIKASKATVDNANKASYLSLAKDLAVTPFATIESAEGVGASYYGLNGGNSVEYLNALRKAFGITELDTKKYSGEHEKYRNHWAPGASVNDDGTS